MFADFKIVVQDHTFNVHRVIIAQGSSFLSKLFSGNFEVYINEEIVDLDKTNVLY